MRKPLQRFLYQLRLFCWKLKYRPGKCLSQFIARDIRRDVEVLDVTTIADGIITGRTKTWNVLYASKGLLDQPPFGEVRQIEIKHLWDWSGNSWGGVVPDSIDGES